MTDYVARYTVPKAVAESCPDLLDIQKLHNAKRSQKAWPLEPLPGFPANPAELEALGMTPEVMEEFNKLASMSPIG
jgi:hypothetical protein